MAATGPVHISYFSDVLCVWAFIAQARVDEIKQQFGDRVDLEFRFCSVFGNTAKKIGEGWRPRGGFEGFNAHLKDVDAQYEHVRLHPDLWLQTRPSSSEGAHLFLKALQLLEEEGVLPDQPVNGKRLSERVTWRLRRAFFEDCRDIANWSVQCEVLDALDVPMTGIEGKIKSGVAFAALVADHEDSERYRLEGSPTFVLNQGRQKLYGNLGYRIIEANIEELLHQPGAGEASWC